MAIVESVVELLLQKLADPLIREAIFLHGVGEQVEWLEAEFRRMRCFLEDADAKQEGDRRVKGWVGDVRDVAYDAEDVIDTFVFKVANLRRSGFVGCIRRYACFFNELIARHGVGSKIERIKTKIHAISESRSTYGIENIGQGAGTSSAGLRLQQRRCTSPNVEEPDFVGFDKDLEILVARLTEGERRRCVVSLVGMGGLGKTTLTKKLYNTVKKHFQSHAWISVSQEFSARDLLQAIVRQWAELSNRVVETMNIAEVRDKISEYLNDKRYLVVLDDIWKREAWDALKDAFPDVNNGSRVVLTTRNKDVALHADAQSHPHELQLLEEKESWDLFCKKTFPGRDGACPLDLEELGREIVQKCHGLPLAIVVVGGLLSTKEAREWENVRKSISWQFMEGEIKISSILSMSYKDLPYFLKPCFLYLSNFPEDYEFYARELIRLWAAEGFLQERGEETMEEVGEDCLKELIQRSMVQVAERSSSGGIKSCRIHDLLRDLSISEAKEGMFLQVHHENLNAPAASRTRRLAIHRSDFSFSRCTPHLRSVMIYTEYGTQLKREQEKFLFGGFKLLRVLFLHGIRIKELPKEIAKLIHLRFLRCDGDELKRLPSSIGNLTNLQSLFLTSSYLIEVPSTVWKMQQLRHFQLVDDSIGVMKGHARLERVSNLRTLSKVKAGEWMKGCMGKLTHLRKLGIVLETGADAEVLYESIVKFDCLQSLLVDVRSEELDPLRVLVPHLSHLLKLTNLHLEGKLERLPESTEFPANLTKLTLESSGLEQDPLPMLEKLKNLRILRIHCDSYLGKEMACSAQGFPRLEFLHLDELSELEEWRVEEGAMPCLSHLRIRYCQQLKKLPEGLQHVTKLKKLELWLMPDEFKERLKENEGEDWHKIRHIPSVDIPEFGKWIDRLLMRTQDHFKCTKEENANHKHRPCG